MMMTGVVVELAYTGHRIQGRMLVVMHLRARSHILEAEKLLTLGYEFHYRTQDGVDLFKKRVIGLD